MARLVGAGKDHLLAKRVFSKRANVALPAPIEVGGVQTLIWSRRFRAVGDFGPSRQDGALDGQLFPHKVSFRERGWCVALVQPCQ